MASRQHLWKYATVARDIAMIVAVGVLALGGLTYVASTQADENRYIKYHDTITMDAHPEDLRGYLRPEYKEDWEQLPKVVTFNVTCYSDGELTVHLNEEFNQLYNKLVPNFQHQVQLFVIQLGVNYCNYMEQQSGQKDPTRKSKPTWST